MSLVDAAGYGRPPNSCPQHRLGHVHLDPALTPRTSGPSVPMRGTQFLWLVAESTIGLHHPLQLLLTPERNRRRGACSQPVYNTLVACLLCLQIVLCVLVLLV